MTEIREAGKEIRMARCRQCDVTISDDTRVCPLCRCAVEASSGQASGNINEYPDVRIATRRMKYVCNIILAAAVAGSGVLIVCNAAFYSGSWWCVIPVGALVYIYLAFRLLSTGDKGYRMKVFMPMMLAGLLVLIIDMATGFHRWSLNYVFPAEVMAADLIILILMLTNLKNWQSYIIMEVAVTAAAVGILLLWLTGIVTAPTLSVIAFAISVIMTVTAIIVGDRAARTELKRRFHIR